MNSTHCFTLHLSWKHSDIVQDISYSLRKICLMRKEHGLENIFH